MSAVSFEHPGGRTAWGRLGPLGWLLVLLGVVLSLWLAPAHME